MVHGILGRRGRSTRHPGIRGWRIFFPGDGSYDAPGGKTESVELSIYDWVVDERDLSVGIVSSIQTHGSLANWHPHLHLLVTDGGFRPDGAFVHLPFHDVATLTEAFRRAVLKMFVKRELMDLETAQSMLNWPHSGFHVHDGV